MYHDSETQNKKHSNVRNCLLNSLDLIEHVYSKLEQKKSNLQFQSLKY